MEPFTFEVDVADEIHDCAWIQAVDQLVYLPVSFLRHIVIDGVSTFCGLSEVNTEPICMVGLLQGVQELRLWLEAAVDKHSRPFAGVMMSGVVRPVQELVEALIYICLGGAVETQTSEKLLVGLPPRSYGQGSQGNGHAGWREEDVLAL